MGDEDAAAIADLQARVQALEWSSGEGWIPALEAYKTYRGQIEAESTLVGVRLGWLIGAEAFLVAGYAAVLTVNNKDSPADFLSKAHQLFTFLPIAGIVLAALMGLSIWSALFAMGRVTNAFKASPPAPPAPVAVLPSIVVDRKRYYYGGGIAPYLVPMATIVGWVYLLTAGSG